MGRCYGHFSLEERCELSRLSHAGKTIRQIAAAMDRAPSTVARELKRNSGAKVGYQPAYAEQQAKSRRWRGCRLLRDTALQEQVLHGLRRGWSPAQVAGRLKRENRGVISYESIYRFIDAQIRRTQDYSWRHYLPRGKSERGWRGRKGGRLVDRIAKRVPIEQRPAYVHKRRQPGHWEGDLMLFAKYGQAVLVTHERRSRLLIVNRQPKLRPLRLWRTGFALCLAVCRNLYVAASPSITVRTSLITTGSINSRCSRFSVILLRHGKKAGLKTPLDACAEDCREKLTWLLYPIIACSIWCVPIIILRESVLTTKLRQKFSAGNCCT